MTKNIGIVENFLFILCLFPYISVIKTPFDTQPYALLLAAVFLTTKLILKKNLNIPIKLVPYILIFFYAFVTVLIKANFNEGLRSLIGYATVAILSIAGYHSFNYIKGIYFFYSINIWFLFSIIQTFFNKNFGSYILARISTSPDRGVTSLAVEPSAFSIMCIFFLILNDLFYLRGDYSKKRYKYIFVITLIQLLLSRAAMGFILIAIYLVVKSFTNGNIFKKLRNILITLIFGGILYKLFTTITFLVESRIGNLLRKLESGVMVLILNDGSISDRLSHILISFVSIFYSFGLGYGLGTWDEYALDISHTSGTFINEVSSVNFTLGRIMSGWGTAIFELGIVGIIFILTFFIIMKDNYKVIPNDVKETYVLISVTIFVTMLMSVTLSFPLFGFLMGAILNMKSTYLE